MVAGPASGTLCLHHRMWSYTVPPTPGPVHLFRTRDLHSGRPPPSAPSPSPRLRMYNCLSTPLSLTHTPGKVALCLTPQSKVVFPKIPLSGGVGGGVRAPDLCSPNADITFISPHFLPLGFRTAPNRWPSLICNTTQPLIRVITHRYRGE